MELMAWAKPETVLLEGESDAVGEDMELYASVLEKICGSSEPSTLNLVEARCVTQALWVFQRHCGSAAALNA